MQLQYRKLGVDIEVLPPVSGRMPTADVDPIIIISLSFDPPYQDKPRNQELKTMVLAVHSYTKSMVYKDVFLYRNESEMLDVFMGTIKRYDPDIICGYNTHEFDFPYINDRIANNGIWNSIGRNGRGWQIRQQREDQTTVYIPGRISIDLLPMVKKHANPTEIKGMKPLKQFSLGVVAHTLLDIEKGDVKPSEMRELWIGPRWIEMIDYARRDAELNIALLNKLAILDRYTALAKASGCLLQDVVNGGQTKLIDSLIIRNFNKVGRVVPPRVSWDDVGETSDVLYEGAVVLDPEIGLHEGIVIMDFASLYPSIMRAYNLSPDTLMKGKDGVVSFNKDRHGIVPGILERLYTQRVEIKGRMKAEKDKDKKNLLNAEQYAVKILLNSIYGYFGYTKSRLFEVAIASAVTRVGRESLLKTKAVIENEFGYKVITGDTDSVFVKLPEGNYGFAVVKKIANSISARMSELLPAPMQLSFEAFGERGIILAKKRYGLWITEDGHEYTMKFRGIEVRRRDWTDLTEETLSTVLDILLKEGNIKGAADYAIGQIRRIECLESVKDDPELMQKLVLTKKFSKPLEEYKTKTVHGEALKRHIARGGAPYALGDRLPYYITDSKNKPVSETSELAEDVIDGNLPISKKYYINKQLIPPLERIFEALKFNLRTGKFESKQLTWGDL